MNEQEIVIDFPPLWDRITDTFPGVMARSDVVFSWGPRIYNPNSIILPPEILAHEAIHGMRQGTGAKVTNWWLRYLENGKFRLREEAAAHRAEFQWLIEHGNRSQRRSALRRTANKLASPLYGPMVNQGRARAILRGSSG